MNRPNGRTAAIGRLAIDPPDGFEEKSLTGVAQDTTPVSFRPGELEITSEGVGHLLGSRCLSCGSHYFPVREVCAGCLSEDMEAIRFSRSGIIYTFTIVRQSTPAFEVPYVLAYVDLPERVRVMGQVADCEPEDVHIGMRVQLCVEPFGSDDDGNDLLGYRFRPEKDVND